VDGNGPIVSDTTALVFISGGNRTPVEAYGLEPRLKELQLKATCQGRSAGRRLATG